MKHIKYLGFTLSLIFLAACQPENIATLEENQATWDSLNEGHYTYTMQTNLPETMLDLGNLELDIPSPSMMTITVVDNVVTKAEVNTGFPAFLPQTADLLTFPGVSENIAKVIPTIDMHFNLMRVPATTSPSFEASYDVNYGYPTDYSFKLIDNPLTPEKDEAETPVSTQITSYTVNAAPSE